MISNQILQNTIEGLKGITRVEFCVIDTDGKTLASTFAEHMSFEEEVLLFAGSQADSQVVRGYQFFKIYDEHQLEYILVVNGGSEDAYMVGKIAVFQIQNLLVAYKERFDKDNFVKNLLLDNLLLVDIYNRAKKLHIDTDVRRVIFIVEMKHDKDSNVLDNVRSVLGNKTRDFVTAVDEKNIIVVKELEQGDGHAEEEQKGQRCAQPGAVGGLFLHGSQNILYGFSGLSPCAGGGAGSDRCGGSGPGAGLISGFKELEQHHYHPHRSGGDEHHSGDRPIEFVAVVIFLLVIGHGGFLRTQIYIFYHTSEEGKKKGGKFGTKGEISWGSCNCSVIVKKTGVWYNIRRKSKTVPVFIEF